MVNYKDKHSDPIRSFPLVVLPLFICYTRALGCWVPFPLNLKYFLMFLSIQNSTKYFHVFPPSTQKLIGLRGEPFSPFFILVGCRSRQTFCVCLSELPSIYQIIIALTHREVGICGGIWGGIFWGAVLGTFTMHFRPIVVLHVDMVQAAPPSRQPDILLIRRVGAASVVGSVRVDNHVFAGFSVLRFIFSLFFCIAVLLPLMCHAPRRRALSWADNRKARGGRADQSSVWALHARLFFQPMPSPDPDPRSLSSTK